MLRRAGLLADNGDTLYLEFTDGWQESACSTWVRQHILPPLGQGGRLTRHAAGQRLFDWLLSLDAPLILLADSDYDTVLLTELLQQCGLTHDSFRIEQLFSPASRRRLNLKWPNGVTSYRRVPHHTMP
ncbi:MAG: hypothetical protein K9K38_10925 [Rhodoferax sp.]|nr:hypothetical protein [Rhodoferax sp.]